MARIGVIAAAVLVVAAAAAAAAERSGGAAQCMAECYFDCAQIKIFSDGECKRDCVFACAKHGNVKKLRDQDDDYKFFPYWI
ncbi:hypothetical protein AAHA92_23615 [Salvia divinorum]|uniref:Uncharacterized protein n=1 Tax=Salvia divinorum TaxID=28513 RepID=A0ABD1GSM0_SALDI